MQQAQAAAQQAEASKQESEAAAVMAKAVAQDHAWRQGSSGVTGRKQEAAAEVRSQAAAAAAGSEEQLVDAERRREQHLHLRVAVKAGTAPARRAGQATLKQVLLDRLGMSEESVAQVMLTVSQVQIPQQDRPRLHPDHPPDLPIQQAGGDQAAQQVAQNGSPEPALAIGHDLTPTQCDAHAKLFPVMHSLYDRGLRQMEMIYYPAVCLRVCGRLYSDAAAATRAGEAALRRSPIQLLGAPPLARAQSAPRGPPNTGSPACSNTGTQGPASRPGGGQPCLTTTRPGAPALVSPKAMGNLSAGRGPYSRTSHPG
jgi:hypothetical protein